MRIDQAATAAALQTRLLGLLKGQEGTPGFKADVAAPAVQPSVSAQAGPAVPVNSLAMLVAAAAAPLPRTAAIRRAEKGLAVLERLHRLLGSGVVTSEALNELAGWQLEGGMGEGGVGELLGEIELRILVELAKHGR